MNFDQTLDRRGTRSMKWDVQPGELPMGLADMDFETADEIKTAILRRAAHGAYGYTIVSDDWFSAYQSWWQERHDWTIQKEWIYFCTGVVPAISSLVRKLSDPAEKVVLMTPVYNIFFNSILNNGRQILESPLHYDGEQYRIDFADLESKLSDPQTTLLILCHPHNPIGKIWDRETLAKIGELCAKTHVTVISDEIHCDLVEPGKKTIPFASVSPICRDLSVTCIAPTKTFNLAGLQTAAVVIPNPVLRHRVWRAINTDEIAEPNVFAMEAAVAAFEQGGPWLDELQTIIVRNKRHAQALIHENLPMLHVVKSEATYLLWIDCRQIAKDTDELAEFLRESTGLILNPGKEYGESGQAFLRMNVAVSMERLNDGLDRLHRGVKAFMKRKG